MKDHTSKYADKLMPCPTCRVTAVLQEGGSFAADDCKFRAGCEKCRDFEYAATIDEVIAKWNGILHYHEQTWEYRLSVTCIQLGYDLPNNKLTEIVNAVNESGLGQIAIDVGASDNGESIKFDVALKLCEFMNRK